MYRFLSSKINLKTFSSFVSRGQPPAWSQLKYCELMIVENPAYLLAAQKLQMVILFLLHRFWTSGCPSSVCLLLFSLTVLTFLTLACSLSVWLVFLVSRRMILLWDCCASWNWLYQPGRCCEKGCVYPSLEVSSSMVVIMLIAAVVAGTSFQHVQCFYRLSVKPHSRMRQVFQANEQLKRLDPWNYGATGARLGP